MGNKINPHRNNEVNKMINLAPYIFLVVTLLFFWFMGKAIIDGQKMIADRTEYIRRIADALEKIAEKLEKKK